MLDQEVAPIIKQIFTDYVNGKRVTEIARGLEEKGFDNYGRMHIVRIIKNKRYTGRYIYNLNGKEICTENGLPRIVSDELFELAQQKREERKMKTNAGGKYATNSFSGHIKCAYCGATVSLTSTKTYDKKNRYHYYRCSAKCENKMYVKKNKVDDVVFGFLHNELFTKENVIAISKKAEELQKNTPTNTNYENQLKEVQKKIDNITKAIENGNFIQSLLTRLEELEKEKEELKIKIATVPKKKNLTSNEIYDYLMQYVNGDFQDEEFQKTLINTFVSCIELKKDGLKVDFIINSFVFSQSFVFGDCT